MAKPQVQNKRLFEATSIKKGERNFVMGIFLPLNPGGLINVRRPAMARLALSCDLVTHKQISVFHLRSFRGAQRERCAEGDR